MRPRKPDAFAGAAALATPGDWLAFAEKLYAREHLALGQVATDAHDEALYLLLRTLDLPLDSEASVLRRKLTAAERAKVENVFRRRVLERVPAAYLTREAWLGEHRFYVDERVIIPRSYFLELIPDALTSLLPPGKKVRRAIDVSRGAGRKVAFTLSDAFIIDRHGADFRALIAEGLFDILFANEVEIQALAETDDFEAAVAKIAPQVPLLVVTRGSHGAIALQGGERTEVPAEPIDTVVDTTGAGDLFAAGFLSGLADGRSIHDCLTMGAVCAREIIAQVGPRAQTDLKAAVAKRLG